MGVAAFLRIAGASLLVAMVSTARAEAVNPPDYESLPALRVVDASRSVMLDIARAGSRLVSVGERGIILYSDDHGQSWQQAQVPVSNTLTAVTFIGAERGWAAGHGGIILHSSDGGVSWLKQFDGNEANRQWLEFMKARKAGLEKQVAALRESANSDPDTVDDLVSKLEDADYAVEDAQTALENGPVDPFLDIWFADAANGIAVGAYGMIYRTEDGGESWQLSAGGIDNPYRYHYYDIDADGEGRLYLSGEGGLMYRSLDVGRHWQQLGPFYEGSLFGVVTRGNEVLSFGLRGNIFQSVDGGEHWRALDPVPFSVYGGCRLNNGDVVLVGAGGGFALSRDGTHFSDRVHDSRSSFSAVSGDGAGGIVAVGMGGALQLAGGAAR